ncbi:competence type IV pilus minor pilin ComGF [Virgibacillus dokdonensis]|nr:ComGF family competence protein [Virgibacillus dokdonensis]
MRNKQTKKSVFMPSHLEYGFTFVTTSISIVVLVFSIPFVSYLLRQVSVDHAMNDLSVGQFFIFMRNEVMQAEEIKIYPHQLKLSMHNGDEATFEKYGNLIRRQVDGTGHEIYLRDIKDITFSPLSYGFHIIITTMKGEKYDKKIIYYP